VVVDQSRFFVNDAAACSFVLLAPNAMIQRYGPACHPFREGVFIRCGLVEGEEVMVEISVPGEEFVFLEA